MQFSDEELERAVDAGVWFEEGELHFDVPKIMAVLGIPPTEENQQQVVEALSEASRERLPEAAIEVRNDL